ncbi:type 2 lanthipeptide synthetase LanM [Macrococcoides caseolyticum]|uniref:type 2 lanthipeptide synthetase LanM n=1 Tax=Macrococcoides caseolyticum TaxID=69966 RepID=UPI0012FEC55A|nr:type 2 lanthipeptide synthetase LanM [Macrococcus caseolyticus]
MGYKEAYKFHNCLYDFSMSILKYINPEILYKTDIFIETINEDIYLKFENVIFVEFEKNNIKDMKNFSEKICSKSYIEKFLLEYKFLINNVTKIIDNDLCLIDEILTNYREDKEVIKKIYGYEFGEIKNIHLGQGDRHNGVTVAKVEFLESNLIYKPRKCHTSIFYESLLQSIEILSGENETFKFPKRIMRENYCWEECIINLECQSEDDALSYYYKAGKILGLFYILNSYDMHHENIIASGKYPVIIDHETIAKGYKGRYLSDNTNNNFSNSILNTCFIPFKSKDNLFDVNVSGLLAESKDSETMYEYNLIEDQSGSFVYKKFSRGIENIGSKVKIKNGKSVSLDLISQELKNGFEKFVTSVFLNKSKCISIINNLIEELGEENLVLRQLLRPTQVYFDFINAKYHESMAINKRNYENVLDILYDNFDPSEFGYLRVEREIQKIMNGDVPLFYTYFNSKDLYEGQEKVIEDYYDFTIMEKVREKILNLNLDNINTQLSYISLSLSMLNNPEELGKTGIEKPIEIFDYDFVLKEYIDYIMTLRCQDINGNQDILLTNLSEENSSTSTLYFHEIDSNIYQTGGLLLLLLFYGDKYHDNKVLEFVKNLFENKILNTSNNRTIKDFSPFVGCSSNIYIANHFYKVFKEPKYLEFIESEGIRILEVYNNTKLPEENLNYLTGVPGMLQILGEISDMYRLNKVQIILNKSILKLIDEFNNSKEFKNSKGFAHGINGYSFALNKIYSIKNDTTILEHLKLINDIEEKSTSLIDYSDLRWCHGVTGILNERISLLKNLEIEVSKDGIIKNIVEGIEQNWEMQENYCLCHGVYGNEMLIRDASKDINININLDYHKNFRSIFSLKWFKENKLPFDLFMLGSSGVAYSLLRSKHSDLPNILQLEC